LHFDYKEAGITIEATTKMISNLKAMGRAGMKTPEEVESVAYFNTSVYLVKKSMLEFALKNLHNDNAQQEEYLSDIIAILAKRSSVKMKIHNINERSKIQGFNNPAELLEIENNIRAADKSKKTQIVLSPKQIRPIQSWYKDINAILKGKTPV
jgi:bifunctional N-acetylglucosamine-1-phosphate-uridyltransferase/glucosamine-1-phosphate-acetyltransferase GlmU-like protein